MFTLEQAAGCRLTASDSKRNGRFYWPSNNRRQVSTPSTGSLSISCQDHLATYRAEEEETRR